MLNSLKLLCEANGASGSESGIRKEIIRQISGFCEWKTDALGNIIAFKKGAKTPAHRIMLDAHTDEVGFIATYIESNGLIRFSPVGGINTECILSQRIIFQNGTVGVIGCKPMHLSSADERKKLPKTDSLYIDIGCDTREETEKYVSLGDTAVFESPFMEKDGIITAKAIDDRAGCAVLIRLLREESDYDFYATFTVQEEIGTRGAMTAAYTVAPDFCLCLESTTASDIEGVSGAERVSLLGEGPVISFMDRTTLYDRGLFDTAKGLGLPYQIKTAVSGGNNAGAIHKSRGGVRTLAISVPCRYIHSAAGVAVMSDIESSYLLAKKMISTLGENYND